MSQNLYRSRRNSVDRWTITIKRFDNFWGKKLLIVVVIFVLAAVVVVVDLYSALYNGLWCSQGDRMSAKKGIIIHEWTVQ